jgi:hypothetical protein
MAGRNATTLICWGAVAKLGQVDPGCNLTLQVRSCSLLEPLVCSGKRSLAVETTPRQDTWYGVAEAVWGRCQNDVIYRYWSVKGLAWRGASKQFRHVEKIDGHSTLRSTSTIDTVWNGRSWR